MKKLLLLLVLFSITALTMYAGTWYVSPVGTDDPLHGSSTGTGAFRTIQYAITRAVSGDVIRVASGTYIASNTLIDKTLTIEGTGATRDAVVIVPAAEDGNLNVTYDPTAQNGFIIKAHNVAIRKLTINGRGNNALTAGKNNFRTGIVTMDASQPGGGVWNNLHVDDVFIKYTYRRGISVFPKSVSGTVIENSRIDNVAYNHGMYLAGQSQAVNNTITHCFQGIVLSLDESTPGGLCRVNGNTLTQISNFPGCFGDQGGGTYSFQPRAIEFDNSNHLGRDVEIRNNIINDNGSVGLRGTVGIYTRLANSASLVENNAITLTSGASIATGGSQSVGLLLCWTYDNGFTARNNTLSSSGFGIGIMIYGSGSVARPLILEGNLLTSTGSVRSDTADGTGIYIANQYLYAADNKNSAYVIIRNHNTISGFVKGIEVMDCANSAFDVSAVVHNNTLAGNTTGIDASTLATPIDAINNYWGGTGPKDAILYPTATGSSVSTGVSFTPWWCDAAMTTACPVMPSGMSVMNTITGQFYGPADLGLAFTEALNGHSLFVAAGTVAGTTFNFPGKTVTVNGTGIPGESEISGASPALTVDGGTLKVNGIEFTMPSVNDPTVLVNSGNLVLRNCILNESAGGNKSCLAVTGGSADAGTENDYGNNTFIVNLPGSAVDNAPVATLWALGNNWGSPTGPSIASNFNGTGGAITGAGQDEVVYGLYRTAPVTTISTVTTCEGITTVDIPVTVSNFNNVGNLSLTFGFTTVQLSNPTLVDINPGFIGWDPFTFTTDPLLLSAGLFKVSGFGSIPSAGVTLPDDSPIFTLRFTVLGNAMAAVSFVEDLSGTACEYAGVAPGHPFSDFPISGSFRAGGVIFNKLQKISGTFTYYNPANTPLTNGITIGLYQDGSQVGTDYAVTGSSYEFPGLCPGIYEIRATSGKPTAGSVNTTDAAQVNNWGPHPFAIEKVRFYAGDVTQENFLSSIDAHKIQQNFVNGTPFTRPPWTFWNAGTTISANPVSAPDYPLVNLLPGTDLTVNMYGLCTGDFNRSFNPGAKKMASATLELLHGKSVQADKNQEIDLPIRIVNPSSVGAVSLIINFPASLAEVLDVQMNSAYGELDWALRGDELRIGWNSLNPATLGALEHLVILKLKTKESFTNDNVIKLTLATDPLNELANDQYDVIGNAVLVVDILEASPIGIGENAKGMFRLYNYPNPFASRTTLSYYLPYRGKVIVDVKNTMGITVSHIVTDFQEQGEHTLALDCSTLPQGIYTATIQLQGSKNSESNTIKLIISR